jgi:hypothetical protein
MKIVDFYAGMRAGLSDDTKPLTRINRKCETRNTKSETNSKYQNSNVSNKIKVATN